MLGPTHASEGCWESDWYSVLPLCGNYWSYFVPVALIPNPTSKFSSSVSSPKLIGNQLHRLRWIVHDSTCLGESLSSFINPIEEVRQHDHAWTDTVSPAVILDLQRHRRQVVWKSSTQSLFSYFCSSQHHLFPKWISD